jgi:hypothetical protein
MSRYATEVWRQCGGRIKDKDFGSLDDGRLKFDKKIKFVLNKLDAKRPSVFKNKFLISNSMDI